MVDMCRHAVEREGMTGCVEIASSGKTDDTFSLVCGNYEWHIPQPFLLICQGDLGIVCVLY